MKVFSLIVTVLLLSGSTQAFPSRTRVIRDNTYISNKKSCCQVMGSSTEKPHPIIDNIGNIQIPERILTFSLYVDENFWSPVRDWIVDTTQLSNFSTLLTTKGSVLHFDPSIYFISKNGTLVGGKDLESGDLIRSDFGGSNKIFSVYHHNITLKGKHLPILQKPYLVSWDNQETFLVWSPDENETNDTWLSKIGKYIKSWF